MGIWRLGLLEISNVVDHRVLGMGFGYYCGPKANHICSHVRSDLRGCNRLANHDGPHYNIYAPRGETWSWWD